MATGTNQKLIKQDDAGEWYYPEFDIFVQAESALPKDKRFILDLANNAGGRIDNVEYWMLMESIGVPNASAILEMEQQKAQAQQQMPPEGIPPEGMPPQDAPMPPETGANMPQGALPMPEPLPPPEQQIPPELGQEGMLGGIEQLIASLPPEIQQIIAQLPPEQQAMFLQLLQTDPEQAMALLQGSNWSIGE